MGQTIPTYITHLNQLLEAAGRQKYAQPSITFKDIVKGVYFDPSDTFYNMYEEEYEWEVLIKRKIDPLIKQREEKYLYLYIEEEV